MNREIKFRAWDTLQGGKFEFWDSQSNRCDGIFWDMIKDKSFKPPQEFTGLLDHSTPKKEIYEGDIFEIVFYDCENVVVVYGKVVKIFGGYHVEFKHPENDKIRYVSLFELLKSEQKVIQGNIYENPELIS
jgi:hypothetical protein